MSFISLFLVYSDIWSPFHIVPPSVLLNILLPLLIIILDVLGFGFSNVIKIQFGISIRTLCSDNAYEYLLNQFH